MLKCAYQRAGIRPRNTCTKFEPETLRLKWYTLPKMAEDDQGKILSGFQIQANEQVRVSVLDIVLVDKVDKKSVVVVVAVRNNQKSRRRNKRNQKNTTV